jgi:uncharacterized membrane protein
VTGARLPRSAAAQAATAARIESGIARLLTWGTRLALGLVFLGVAGMVIDGVDPMAPGAQPAFSLARIPGDVMALRPGGFLWAGLTVLVALPLGRVLVSGAGFLAAGDRRLALVSLLVIAVIAVSVVAALGLQG